MQGLPEREILIGRISEIQNRAEQTSSISTCKRGNGPSTSSKDGSSWLRLPWRVAPWPNQDPVSTTHDIDNPLLEMRWTRMRERGSGRMRIASGLDIDMDMDIVVQQQAKHSCPGRVLSEDSTRNRSLNHNRNCN